MMQLPSMITSLVRSIMTTKTPTETTVHEFTDNPNKAWEMLSITQTVKKANLMGIKTPINPNKVRFVCISDTHNRLPLRVSVPDGDVLLHAGDFTMVGKHNEVESFNTWIGTLPHRHKIVIAGNHELSFDPDFISEKKDGSAFNFDAKKTQDELQKRGITHIKELLTNCTYLEDSGTSVFGITVYGSPWQPEFCDWGFNLPRGQECLDKWNLIPAGVDVLMTHGPPIGHGDMCTSGFRAGCVELLNTIQNRVRCKYHVFGHIHEGYGATTDDNTTYINACTCTLNYRPCNNPIIFDIPLPPGVTKEEFLATGAVAGDSQVTEDATQVGEDKEVTDSSGEEVEEGEEEGMIEEMEEDRGPLVLNQDYQLEPTLAPHSSTSTHPAVKMS